MSNSCITGSERPAAAAYRYAQPCEKPGSACRFWGGGGTCSFQHEPTVLSRLLRRSRGDGGRTARSAVPTGLPGTIGIELGVTGGVVMPRRPRRVGQNNAGIGTRNVYLRFMTRPQASGRRRRRVPGVDQHQANTAISRIVVVHFPGSSRPVSATYPRHIARRERALTTTGK
jgi:hypothetical protein